MKSAKVLGAAKRYNIYFLVAYFSTLTISVSNHDIWNTLLRLHDRAMLSSKCLLLLGVHSKGLSLIVRLKVGRPGDGLHDKYTMIIGSGYMDEAGKEPSRGAAFVYTSDNPTSGECLQGRGWCC